LAEKIEIDIAKKNPTLEEILANEKMYLIYYE